MVSSEVLIKSKWPFSRILVVLWHCCWRVSPWVVGVHVPGLYSPEREFFSQEFPFYYVSWDPVHYPFFVVYVVYLYSFNNTGGVPNICPYLDASGVGAVSSLFLFLVSEERVVFCYIYCYLWFFDGRFNEGEGGLFSI